MLFQQSPPGAFSKLQPTCRLFLSSCPFTKKKKGVTVPHVTSHECTPSALSRCPVCRYCQTPEPVEENKCFECGVQEVPEDLEAALVWFLSFPLTRFLSLPLSLPLQNLWICLICGHIGCGRYVSRHAYKHFEETQHTYAMQLTNHRVWDYAGGESEALL